jgi:four helix bundle protein
MLAYKRLDVYQCAVRALALCARVGQEMPTGYAFLGDQLRRAATSIPLNVAEGSGRAASGDAARFYAIARGSAMECAAIVDACVALGIGERGVKEELEGLFVRIVEMLTRMCR